MTEIFEREPTAEELAAQAEWEAGAYDREVLQIEQERQTAFQRESDPLFFKYQRNEDGVTKADWLAKVDEIRERYPLPVKGE